MAPFFFACATGPQTELERLKAEMEHREFLSCMHALFRREVETRVRIVYPEPATICRNYVRRRLR